MSHNKSTNNKSKVPGVDHALLSRESWKIFQIMAEFVDGFEKLSVVCPSVSLFGSVRTPAADEVIEVIQSHYPERDYEPSPEEREIMPGL